MNLKNPKLFAEIANSEGFPDPWRDLYRDLHVAYIEAYALCVKLEAAKDRPSVEVVPDHFDRARKVMEAVVSKKRG